MSTAVISRPGVPQNQVRSRKWLYAQQQAERQAQIDENSNLRDCCARGSTPKTELPPNIHLEQSGDLWFAHGGGEQVKGKSPADALYRLEIRLGICVASTETKEENQMLERSIHAPVCEVLDFSATADVDKKHHYHLDFLSNVDLLRSDVEKLFPALVSRESVCTREHSAFYQ